MREKREMGSETGRVKSICVHPCSSVVEIPGFGLWKAEKGFEMVVFPLKTVKTAWSEPKMALTEAQRRGVRTRDWNTEEFPLAKDAEGAKKHSQGQNSFADLAYLARDRSPDRSEEQSGGEGDDEAGGGGDFEKQNGDARQDGAAGDVGGVIGALEAAAFGEIDQREAAEQHADEAAKHRDDHAAENGAAEAAEEREPARGGGSAAAAHAPARGEPFDDVHGRANGTEREQDGPAGEFAGAGQERGAEGRAEHEPGAGNGKHGEDQAAEAQQRAGGPGEKDAGDGHPLHQRGADFAHSLTPPEVRPVTRSFWQARKRSVMGTPERTAVAAKSPQR